MVNNSIDDFLEHKGILGMHWGHKKAAGWSPKDNSTKSGHPPNEIVKQHIAKSGGAIPKAFEKTKTTLTKPRLTDTQLKTVINRLQMEKTYAELTKKKVSPGKKIVTDILLNAGKSAATAYLDKLMKEQLHIDPASIAAAAAKAKETK